MVIAMTPPDSLEYKSDDERLLDAMYGEVTHTLGLASTPRGIVAQFELSGLVPQSEASSLRGIGLPVRAFAQSFPPETPNIVGKFDPSESFLVVIEDIVAVLVHEGHFPAAAYWGDNYKPQSLLVIPKDTDGLGSFIKHTATSPLLD